MRLNISYAKRRSFCPRGEESNGSRSWKILASLHMNYVPNIINSLRDKDSYVCVLTYKQLGMHLHVISTHYGDIMMGAMASQITSPTIVYSTVYSDADQRKHQSSASLAFVRGIHRGPVNSLHKRPVTQKMFPFDDDMVNTDVLTLYHHGEVMTGMCFLRYWPFVGGSTGHW